LTNTVVKRLHTLGWEPVTISDGAGLRANLKAQLEAHNGVSLSEAEFTRVLNHLDKGNVFDKAKILRDRMALTRDDGTTVYIQFLNAQEWCRNRYQVTSQVTQVGSYKTRFCAATWPVLSPPLTATSPRSTRRSTGSSRPSRTGCISRA